MNFKLERNDIIYLVLVTFGLGVMQVTTPLFLRTLIDGIIPSRDGATITLILGILGANELLLIFSNGALNRQLDNIERRTLEKNRDWMLAEVTKPNQEVKDPDIFYQAWTSHIKQLVYKKIKNPWYRTKDFVVLILLTFICINISYLAGFLVILIAIISLITVKYFQENQGSSGRQLHIKSQEEKKLFNEVLVLSSSEKVEKIIALKSLTAEVNDLQFKLAKERSSYQDINNLIRFTIMFSILGAGGFLYATGKLSMGSLWALLITMYRITPSLQSIMRWFIQTRSDDNLEDRVWEGLKTKTSFKKPEFYNRMVKIVERYLQIPGPKWVKVHSSLSNSDLVKSLELWKSFFSKKDQIEIIFEDPEAWDSTKTYIFIGDYEGQPKDNLLVFSQSDVKEPQGYEVHLLT